MAQKLKVGIIGLGGIAHTHVPGWTGSPYTELVAGSDVNPVVFPTWREKYGVSRFYENPDDLINDPEIDIIDICTPNMYHAPQVIAALEAGKHVICEKPLAPTPEEIRQMIAARDRSGKMLMTAQHFRFKGNSQAMKAEIDSGPWADIYHARSLDAAPQRAACTRPTFIYKSQSGGGPVHRYRRSHPRSDPVADGPSQTGGGERGGADRPGAPPGCVHSWGERRFRRTWTWKILPLPLCVSKTARP